MSLIFLEKDYLQNFLNIANSLLKDLKTKSNWLFCIIMNQSTKKKISADLAAHVYIALNIKDMIHFLYLIPLLRTDKH